MHIGECEIIDVKPGGLAVTIAGRLLCVAGPREVVVSQTVRDMVAGSGFSFTVRGEQELKGVPDLWRLCVAEPTEGLPDRALSRRARLTSHELGRECR